MLRHFKRHLGTLLEGEGLTKKVYFLNEKGEKVSPWHSLELFSDHKFVLQGGIEISRNNIAKYEVNLEEPSNPIMQDKKLNKETGKNELRYYAQFPLFNYGFLPQTWENSEEHDVRTQLKGDGDPLDIVELGTHPIATGTQLKVKVLGAMCLVDQGEADWKVLCVDTRDPSAKHLNNPSDLEKAFPGKLDSIMLWFEEIKTYDGKPRNKFLGGVEGPELALEITNEAHKEWNRLKKGEFKSKGYWLSYLESPTRKFSILPDFPWMISSIKFFMMSQAAMKVGFFLCFLPCFLVLGLDLADLVTAGSCGSSGWILASFLNFKSKFILGKT